ncbi:MAG: hypothetical protein E7652_07545 [Ruminococcaceae bacterium]|nr:hypothetical protein [Oscillospiraceae bacterium]
MSKFCGKCGKPTENGLDYCPECEAELLKEQTQTLNPAPKPTVNPTPAHDQAPSAVREFPIIRTAPKADTIAKEKKALALRFLTILGIGLATVLCIALIIFGITKLVSSFDTSDIKENEKDKIHRKNDSDKKEDKETVSTDMTNAPETDKNEPDPELRPENDPEEEAPDFTTSFEKLIKQYRDAFDDPSSMTDEMSGELLNGRYLPEELGYLYAEVYGRDIIAFGVVAENEEFFKIYDLYYLEGNEAKYFEPVLPGEFDSRYFYIHEETTPDNTEYSLVCCYDEDNYVKYISFDNTGSATDFEPQTSFKNAKDVLPLFEEEEELIDEDIDNELDEDIDEDIDNELNEDIDDKLDDNINDELNEDIDDKLDDNINDELNEDIDDKLDNMYDDDDHIDVDDIDDNKNKRPTKNNNNFKGEKI